MTSKFDDCMLCSNEGREHLCAECHSGELFEPIDDEPLDLNDLYTDDIGLYRCVG